MQTQRLLRVLNFKLAKKNAINFIRLNNKSTLVPYAIFMINIKTLPFQFKKMNDCKGSFMQNESSENLVLISAPLKSKTPISLPAKF